jgi:hypothetical protein
MPQGARSSAVLVQLTSSSTPSLCRLPTTMQHVVTSACHAKAPVPYSHILFVSQMLAGTCLTQLAQ